MPLSRAPVSVIMPRKPPRIITKRQTAERQRSLNRGGAEIAQTGGSNRATGRAGDDNGNHCDNCQQSKKNGER